MMGALPHDTSARRPALSKTQRLMQRLGDSLASPTAVPGIVLVTLIAGIASVSVSPTVALRVAIGLPIVLALLRYPYLLLLAWVAVDVFVGSSLPFFNGANLDTALTLPLLLIVCFMPLAESLRRLRTLTILLVFLLWMLTSMGLSPLDTATFIKRWVLSLNYVAIAVLTMNVLTTRRRLMGVIDAILAVSLFVALYGIYGYVTKQNGIVDPGTGEFRITSVFDVATAPALYLSMIIPLACYRAYTLHRLKRLSIVIAAFIYLVAIGLTFSRAAFITLPLACVVAVFCLPSRKAKITLLAAIGTGLSLIILLDVTGILPLLDRFFSQDLTTANGRTLLWSAVLDHFDPSYLLGNGLGSSDQLLTILHIGSNGQTSHDLIANSPHNLFIGTLYDHGIIGLVLLVLTFFVLGLDLVRRQYHALGDRRALSAVAVAVFVIMVVQSLNTNEIWAQAVGLYFWILIALPFARCLDSPSTVNLQVPEEEQIAQAETTQLRVVR